MRRALLVLGALSVLTWLQFQFFPGHTYLRSDTQVYVPILEKLASPGLLSRDLIASHPNVTYTIYDEVTLFLSSAGEMNLHTALVIQQVVFRAAGLLGIFLLARSTGLSDGLSLVVAALVNLGGVLPGPQISIVDLEPTPRSFALGLTFLALGFMAKGMPLLTGLAGGLALVYDLRIAIPFCLVVILSMIFDRGMRRMLRPSVTILAIFALLLANLSQLQPGVPDAHDLFETISPAIARIQQFRTSYVWVSAWGLDRIFLYVVLWCGGWYAGVRIWARLNKAARWIFLLLPALGIVSIPFSYLLLEVARWRVIPQIQPAETVIFTVALTSAACAIAGLQRGTAGKWKESVAFLLLAVAIPVVLRQPRASSDVKEIAHLEAAQLAEWAQSSTWGGSMFSFPDAERAVYPGIFRVLSDRAVWVDWQTGRQVAFFDDLADEWFRRWHDTMEGDYNEHRLRNFLSLPIDYYVLQGRNAVRGVTPVFATQQFVVYDADRLRAWSSQSANSGILRPGDLFQASLIPRSSSGDVELHIRRRLPRSRVFGF